MRVAARARETKIALGNAISDTDIIGNVVHGPIASRCLEQPERLPQLRCAGGRNIDLGSLVPTVVILPFDDGQAMYDDAVELWNWLKDDCPVVSNSGRSSSPSMTGPDLQHTQYSTSDS